MATLAVYRGDQLLRRVELGEAPTRIGRSPENELVLEDKDKGVSRTHGKILYDQGRYVIVDLNSQNGVWIGDRRVTRDPLPVDVPVTIGPYRLVLLPDPKAERAADGSVDPLLPPEAEEPFAEPTELVRPEAPVAPVKVAPVPVAPVTVAPVPVVLAKAAAPWPRKRVLVAAVAVVGVVGVLTAALVVAAIARRPPAAVVVAVPSPPPGPTVEQRFQDHYGKAQGYIEKGDKAAATTENAEALNVLPSDPRGLKQQADIAAMIEPPPPPVENPAADPPSTSPPGPVPAGGDAVPLPSTLKVSAGDGEAVSKRNEREKLARNHLDDGKKALAEHRYGTAIGLLQGALDASGRPDYGYTKDEASTLLQSARASLAAAEAAQKRAAAQRLVEEAKALANSDIVGAVRKLREARNLDPQVAEAAELLNGLQDQARVEGENALIRARNFDTFKKTEDAIREFDKAVQLLELVPGGHKDLASARQRSADLKKPK